MPKIICSSSDPKPTTFKFWEMLSEASKLKLIQAMRKKGNLDWQPEEEIEIESSQEAARIMTERPVGTQAIIGKTPVTIKR